MMRHIQILILSLLATLSLSASTTENYFRPGTVWTTSHIQLPEGSRIAYYTILPETTFQGEKVLPFATYSDDKPEPTIERYLRTEGEKVYMRSIRPENPDWYLLYDFGLNVGDEVVVYSFNYTNIDGEVVELAVPSRLKCLERDFYLNNDSFKVPMMRLQLMSHNNDDNYGNYKECQGDWIIGMGYLEGSGNILNSWCWGDAGSGFKTLCVESPEGNVVFGEPLAGIKSPSEISSSKKDSIYNLQGVRISDTTENLPRGIYVTNGKKISVTK